MDKSLQHPCEVGKPYFTPCTDCKLRPRGTKRLPRLGNESMSSESQPRALTAMPYSTFLLCAVFQDGCTPTDKPDMNLSMKGDPHPIPAVLLPPGSLSRERRKQPVSFCSLLLLVQFGKSNSCAHQNSCIAIVFAPVHG